MKHWVLLISILLYLHSCKAQQNTMEEQEIIIPEVDNKFERFDIESFKERKRNNSTYEHINDSIIIYTGANAGYSIALYIASSYFGIVKNYYKDNGYIEIKGISFNNGSEYGIWYKFDEQGSLIEENDTDKGYDFGWKEVILYCEAHKIPLTKGYVTSGFQTTIYKEENDQGTKIWVITYQIAGDQLLELTLDGKTGEELSRKELEFINP